MILRHRIYTTLLTATAVGMMLVGQSRSTHFRYISTYPLDPLPEPTPALAAGGDSLKYNVKDRQGDFVSDKNKNSFYLPDPANIKKEVNYDPISGKYVLTEKVGDVNIKEPVPMTFDEYLKYTEQKERDQYFKERSNAVHLIEDKGLIPPIDMKRKILDRLFGSTKIDIKPQGNMDVTLGGNYQNIDNPNIPIRNRSSGGFDFDMHINMNVVGKIGDKLQLGIKYNTQSGFDFDNQVKLGYTGQQDDIIKEISLGNVSLGLPTRLITAGQSLFGVKTKLQFGRLTWSSIVTQQKSQKQTVTLENGAQRQNFEIRSDQYDENRHFFLAQYFRNHYDGALATLPNITSVVNVTRIEVWVTNRNGTTQNVRDVVALADLGENNPHDATKRIPTAGEQPDNANNNIYPPLANNSFARHIEQVVNYIENREGLTQGQDYEKIYARKLNTTEFTFNPLLGYLSLNSTLNPNEVLGVAYQYEINGKVYKVGEFANDVPSDSGTTAKVLFLKLLKGTTPRPDLPIWNLMMKNIYSLNAYQVSPEDFRLDVYYNDPGAGEKRFINKGGVANVPLIKVLNLDNLNTQGDAQPDGQFDFVPNVTILPTNGKLIFPVVEPFGSYLRNAITKDGSPNTLADQYVYDELYDSTRFVALNYPTHNRYVIRGQYKGSGNGREITLGGANIPKGSVKVSAGGQLLKEDIDYTVDYNQGKVTILNQGILSSGQQIKVDFENSNQFGLQTRTLLGTRLDYLVNKKFNIGATVMNMSERPFTQKVNIGEDPISNTIVGADVKYETDALWLTKLVDKLPFYSTKEISTISAYGEVAHLFAGHQSGINNASGKAQVYIDDFEGAITTYDIRRPINNWRLASTPRGQIGDNGRELFTETKLNNDYRYGVNRAKLAWYIIDNTFYNDRPAVIPAKAITDDPFTRSYNITDLYPLRVPTGLDPTIYPFDLAYYPKDRGPYNFEQTANGEAGYSSGVDADGSLKAPKTRWAGIMRSIDNTDLEASNVEFIEFWMLNPFINSAKNGGGKLYLNLGNVSEDILKDSRQMFENTLSADSTELDNTAWGKLSKNPPLTNAFSNTTGREVQDVGFDGLSDADEKKRDSIFLVNSKAVITNPAALAKLEKDPASDNYNYFKDEAVYGQDSSITSRYKNFNGPDGNSPLQTGGTIFANSSVPDAEDLNKDNALNESESYFSYEIDLNRDDMKVGGNKYIVSSNSNADNPTTQASWLQFRIPIRKYDSKVGGINDFRSIQFMRLYLTGWSDSVILRFSSMDMVRNQWRTFNGVIDPGGIGAPNDNSPDVFFNVGKVSLEEHGSKSPVNYVLPPGIDRTLALGGQTNSVVPQNEASLALTVCGLGDGKSKATFKNVNQDLRRYKHLQLFVHANQYEGLGQVQALKDNEITTFVRLGTDFTENYYQYESPIHLSKPNNAYKSDLVADRDSVWPAQNNVDISLDSLVSLKIERNALNYPHNVPYRKIINGKIISIIGNPDLGYLKEVMLGIKNPRAEDKYNPLTGPADDGQSKCAEVWFDELRLSEFDEQGGTAAVGEVSIKLADLATLKVTGAMHTHGFGQIEQKIDQRFKDDLYQYTVSGTVELGKFFPEKVGLRLPFKGDISQSFSLPEFDPYQRDIRSTAEIDQINTLKGAQAGSSYRQQIQTINTTKGYNFTGVRIAPKFNFKKPQIYDPANLTLSYAYVEKVISDPYILSNSKKNYTGTISWAFSPQPLEFTPFKNLIKSSSKWLDIIKDFNFNLVPSSMSVNTTMERQYGVLKIRSLEDGYNIPTTYNKYFKWSRAYTIKYTPFKALSLDYSATNLSRIDEPNGAIDTKEQRDVIWRNIGKGGRNTNFMQSMTAAYKLPLDKIPALEFLSATASYGSSYNWTAAAQVYNKSADYYSPNPLGNIISNTQNLNGKVDLNFKKMYDKSPFLKTYNNPNPNWGDKKENDKKREAITKIRKKLQEEIDKLIEKRDNIKQSILALSNDVKIADSLKPAKVKALRKEIKDLSKQIRQKRKDLRSKQAPPDPVISIFMRPLLAIKSVTINYKEQKGTTLPGFNPTPQFFGNDNKLSAPGYDFAFGSQPGDNLAQGTDRTRSQLWLDRAASKGWISGDTLLNQRFTQTHVTNMDLSANIEPMPDLKINLTMKRDYSITQSEFFKKIDENGSFQHLNPIDIGSYTISYLPINSFFKPIDSVGLSETYRAFDANRSIISQRLSLENPNSNGAPYQYVKDTSGTLFTDNNYYKGYGPKSQDVLIPAFLAAYTHSDPRKITLNPRSMFPLPNWRITYNGLTKIKALQNIFSSISISHGYSSTLTMTSYQTNLDAKTDNGNLKRIDTLNGNYYSAYSLPNIIINESFSPLIGVDVTLKNQLSFRFDYKKSRTLTMSFADYQLVENLAASFTGGLGYTVKGLKIQFIRIKGKPLRFVNDLKFKLDVSYRDAVIINHRIDNGPAQITSGNTQVTVSPSIDYMINKNMNMRIFVDYNSTTPRISNSFPTTSIRGGITIKFTLAQ
jgi:cell surface protein SprA